MAKIMGLIFIVLLSVALWLSLYIPLKIFRHTIQAETYQAESPVMLLQGAPLSHYESEHAGALAFERFAFSPFGFTLVCLIIFGYAFLWHRIHQKWPSYWQRLLTSFVFLEIYLVMVNIPLAAAMAFHHVGWGLPCTYQWGNSFLMLNLFIGLPILISLAIFAIKRREFKLEDLLPRKDGQ